MVSTPRKTTIQAGVPAFDGSATCPECGGDGALVVAVEGDETGRFTLTLACETCSLGFDVDGEV